MKEIDQTSPNATSRGGRDSENVWAYRRFKSRLRAIAILIRGRAQDSKSLVVSREALQVCAQIISDLTKRAQSLIFRTFDHRWIVKGVMQPRGLTEEYGTTLLRAVADCQHLVEILTRDSFTCFKRWDVMSIPSSFMTATASGRTVLGLVPALSTMKRFPDSCRNMPSAICDRAE